jgi:hypothetical protein
MTRSTDYSLKTISPALLALEFYLFAGRDDEHFLNVAALNASEFVNWHFFILPAWLPKETPFSALNKMFP